MGFLALDFSFCFRVYSAKFITLCLGFVPSCVDAASSSVTPWVHVWKFRVFSHHALRFVVVHIRHTVTDIDFYLVYVCLNETLPFSKDKLH